MINKMVSFVLNGPDEIEILVNHSGTVMIMKTGTMIKHLDTVGDGDNFPHIHIILPKTSTRIKGSESSL